MSYIQFDNSKLPNLEYSLFKEFVRTNRAGGYTSTSITGCNTRKYHGLLVCPVKELGGENFVFLSSMQCSVMQNGRQFNLGLQQYKDESFEPKGHKYMTDFSLDPAAKTTWKVGGVIFSQEIVIVHNANQVMLKYTVEEATQAVTLRLKPFLAFRSIHELTQENMALNTHYSEVANGVSFTPYNGLPTLYLQTSKKVDYVAMPDWYRDVMYIKERYRGYGFKEDLYVPGYFETTLKKGESLYMSASLDELDAAAVKSIKTKYNAEFKVKVPKNDMLNVLIASAEQFLQHFDDDVVMLKAGYHWKRPQMRDMFVALAGIAMYSKNKEVYKRVYEHSRLNLKKMYIDEIAMNSASVDVPLWAFYCFNEMQRWVDPKIDGGVHMPLMKEILELFWNGVPGKMYRQDNGLIYARNEGQPQTWMNAKTSWGELVTPRYGCAVEINGLWYNAIATAVEIATKKKDKEFVATWEPRLAQVGQSFIETFVNPEGFLYDYVDGNYKSPSIRPNMVIAAGLKYSPLSKEQKKAVLDIATRELLTPRGLRSLSPKDPKYKGAIEGNEDERAQCLHQGAAYPWLLSFYADIMVDIHRNSGKSSLRRIIADWEGELFDHGIGSISEQYNGNPPHQAKGAISMAWSVSALLKLIKLCED